jgi:hypothetical protein
MAFEPVMPPYNISDPTATFLSSSCLDFLLIELVPMAYRVTNELEVAAARQDPSSSSSSDPSQQQQQQQYSSEPQKLLDEDEERDAVFYRLETLGYRVGQGLVERYAFGHPPSLPSSFPRVSQLLSDLCATPTTDRSKPKRFSRDRPRFNDTLDAIKFVCKDLWTLVFRKQVDNLKTNHRGVYVLTDNAFRPFSRMSAEAGGQAVLRAQPVRGFPFAFYNQRILGGKRQ